MYSILCVLKIIKQYIVLTFVVVLRSNCKIICSCSSNWHDIFHT